MLLAGGTRAGLRPPGEESLPYACRQVARLVERHANDPEVLAERLGTLRPAPAAALLRLWVDEALPAAWRERADAPLPLDEPPLRGVLAALGGAPRSALVEALEGLADGEAAWRARHRALELLAGTGGGGELGLALRLASRAGAPVVPLDVRTALGATLHALAERAEPGEAAAFLRDAFRRAPPGLLATLVDSLAELEASEALGVVGSALGAAPELDALLVAFVSRVGPRAARPVDERLEHELRLQLSSPEASRVQAAARALGAIGADEAIPDLLELLDREDEVAASAAAALRAISGLGFGPRARDWRKWYEAELAWWREDSAETLALLVGGSPEEVSGALLEISRRRIFREELADAVADVLRRREPDLVRLACGVLGGLGSRAALPALLELLERAPPGLRADVREALVEITGRSLPPEPALWREVLGLR